MRFRIFRMSNTYVCQSTPFHKPVIFKQYPCRFPFLTSWSFSLIRHKQNLLFLSLEPFCTLYSNCDKDIFFKGFQNDAGVRGFLNGPASVAVHLPIKQRVLITTTKYRKILKISPSMYKPLQI